MSSKSYSTVTTTTTNEQDQIQGLNASKVNGDGNTVSMLDGDAIKNALAFGAAVNDQSGVNIGRLLNTVDTTVGQVLGTIAKNSQDTVAAMQSGLSGTAAAINTAYSKSNNSGIDPQMVLLGLGALAVLGWILKG